MSTLRRVAHNVAWLAAGEATVKAALFLVAVIIAQSMGPGGMGIFAIAYAAAVIAVLLFTFGQQEVLIREIARDPGHGRRLLGLARTLQNRVILWSVPVAVAASCLVRERDLRLTLLAFLPYSVLRCAMVTHGAMFKGIDRMDAEVKARTIEIALVLTMLLLGGVCRWPVWSTGASFTVGALIGLLWIASRSSRLPEAAPSETLSITQTFLRTEGIPFLALAVLSQLLSRADTFLLAALGVSKDEIGLYAAAGAPVWGALALPGLCAVALYPTLARTAGSGSRATSTLLPVLGGALGYGLIASVGLTVVRKPLVWIAFGAGFDAAAELLARIAWALPGASTMMVLGAVIAAWRRQRWSLVLLSAMLIASIVLNLIWIPSHGTLAAATIVVVIHSVGAAVLTGLVACLPRLEIDHEA